VRFVIFFRGGAVAGGSSLRVRRRSRNGEAGAGAGAGAGIVACVVGGDGSWLGAVSIDCSARQVE
jgi:hypothetical protein